MPEDYTFWRPTAPPDPTKGPPLDLGGFAGALLGGFAAGNELRNSFMDDRAAAKAKKVTGYDPRDLGMERVRSRSETAPNLFQRVVGGFASGILSGRAAEKAGSDPMYDVKRTLGEQNALMNSIQIGEALQRREELIAGRLQAQEFNSMVGNAIRNGLANDPQTQSDILGWLGEHPEAAQLPSVQNQLRLFGQSRQLMEDRRKREEAAAAQQQALAEGMFRSETTVDSNGRVIQKYENPAISQQFAPPMIERKLQIYEQALRSGDQTRIKAYERELGFDNLSPVSKQQYEAEIEGLNRNPKFSVNSDAYVKERLRIVERYYGMAQREGGTSRRVYNPNLPRGQRTAPILGPVEK